MLRDSDASYRAWAERLRQAGLAPVAILALEMLKPAGVFCGQMLEMASALGGPGFSALGRLLTRPGGISALQAFVSGEASSVEERLGRG
ncbi:MAG: hypothetical protein ACP5G7_01505 [Anaerolineae bacterium]